MATKKQKKTALILVVIAAIVYFFRGPLMAKFAELKSKFAKK